MTPDAAPNTAPGPGPALAAGGADASSRVLHRSLALGMPMATHAKGNYLYMSDGSRILDASGGAAVVSVGHSVPEIVDAVSKQVGTLPYVSSAVFGIEPAEDLANMMCEEAGMARVIFLSGGKTVAAFFAEPVVGAASGCVPFIPGYLKAMKKVCERHGVLFCLDEIMCGAGRTGMMHAWMHDGPEARPDIQTLGKGLCGGYAPLSAVLVGDKVVDVLRRGTGAFVNGYTFQSSGTGTAAGLAVYNYIKEHKLVEQCAARGELLAKLLHEKVGPLKHVGDVRGMGLFWGIELVVDKNTKTPFKYEDNVNGRLADAILARGVAVYHGAGSADGWEGDHIMLCPPYTITEDEVAHIVDVVVDAINAIL
ncbi:hypothetical protein CspHIS471_0606410 [Cutaneotrichosporon sp. HIS471]|nr:hypothetical protein CspHIS471_0606410 [Cutaneotrichosporon sp. HIS471]